MVTVFSNIVSSVNVSFADLFFPILDFLTICTFLEMQCSFSEVSANVVELLHVYTGPMEWVLELGVKPAR